MINKIMNTLDRGEFFCINGALRGLYGPNGISSQIVYKIRGWSNLIEDTVIVEGLVLQMGIYNVVYHSEFALMEVLLINNLEDALNASRNSVMNIIGRQAFLENTLNEYNGEPKDLVKDLIREELITEKEMVQNIESDTSENKPAEINRYYRLRMGYEQITIDNMLKLINDTCGATVNRERGLFICRIDYSTKILEEEFKAYSILDSAIAFDKLLMAGMLSYYGKDHLLLNEDIVLEYVSKDIEDLINIARYGIYDMINFIQRVTSNDVAVSINIKFKED